MTIPPTNILSPGAKTSHDTGACPNAFDPLIRRLVDIAAVAQMMRDDVLPFRTRLALAGPFGFSGGLVDRHHENCPISHAGQLVSLLTGLHELGKCSSQFA